MLALYFALSAHRKYILRSIWAQSWDSVPPAPAWTANIALLSSFGPERSKSNSLSDNSWSISLISEVKESTSELSSSSSANCTSCLRLLDLSAKPVHTWTICFKSESSIIIYWASLESSQKLGLLARISISDILDCFPDTSKSHSSLAYENLPFLNEILKGLNKNIIYP